jgi:hypothetical protein
MQNKLNIRVVMLLIWNITTHCNLWSVSRLTSLLIHFAEHLNSPFFLNAYDFQIDERDNKEMHKLAKSNRSILHVRYIRHIVMLHATAS